MVLGNPYNFAIIISTISPWNIDDSFCNGILFFCIDGEIFPKEIISATLKSEIPQLKQSFMNLAVDEALYSADLHTAFSTFYNTTFPQNLDVDNDYRFDVSPFSFSDQGYHVFAVSNGDQVRILAAKLDRVERRLQYDFDDIKITETHISTEELVKIVARIIDETEGKKGRWFSQNIN